MTIDFIRLQKQESEIRKLVIIDKAEFENELISYFNGSKKIRKYKFFGKIIRPYAYSEHFEEYYNTPEELLRRYKEHYKNRNFIIWNGKLYESEKISIKTERDESAVYNFNSAKEIYSFLKNIQETVDTRGMFTKVRDSLISLREYLVKYGDLDSLTIE